MFKKKNRVLLSVSIVALLMIGVLPSTTFADNDTKISYNDLEFKYSNTEFNISQTHIGEHDTTLTVEETNKVKASESDYKNGLQLMYNSNAEFLTFVPGRSMLWSSGTRTDSDPLYITYLDSNTLKTAHTDQYFVWKWTHYECNKEQTGPYVNSNPNKYTNFTLKIRRYNKDTLGTFASSIYAGSESIGNSHSFKKLSRNNFQKVAGKNNLYEYKLASNVKLPFTIKVICNNYFKNKAYMNNVQFNGNEYANGKNISYTFTKDKKYIDFHFIPGDINNEYTTYVPATWRISVDGYDSISDKKKYTPSKTSINKIKSGKKKATITFKKHPKSNQISRYQVQYRINKTKKWKTKTIKVKVDSKKTVTTTIKKLKKGKKYQFRVRSYKTVKKIKYYSKWSKIKSCKTK